MCQLALAVASQVVLSPGQTLELLMAYLEEIRPCLHVAVSAAVIV